MCDVSVRDAQKTVPHGQVCSSFWSVGWVYFCFLFLLFAIDGRMFVVDDKVHFLAEGVVLLLLNARFNTFALPSWGVGMMQGRHYGV